MTLTEFLLARIAEDEAAAQQAGSDTAMRWKRSVDWMGDDSNGVEADGEQADEYDDGVIVYDEGRPTKAEAEHIARHDPARVLAECEAKRRIVQSRPLIGLPDLPGGAAPGTLDALHDEVERQREFVFRLLALPYAGHPDYDETWRP